LLGDLYCLGELRKQLKELLFLLGSGDDRLHDERTLSRERIVLANLHEGAIKELSLIGGYRYTEKGFVIDVSRHETSLFTATIVTPSGPLRNL
jgi:hypothetical protein